MAVTLAGIQGRARAAGYIKNVAAAEEDRRTRYVYSPCETIWTSIRIVGNKSVGMDRGWCMEEISQGVITKVVKRDYFDSVLDEGEMAKQAAYYRMAAPRIWQRDGESPTAGLEVRQNWPLEQTRDIITQYARIGVVELVSPLNYNDAMFPEGWTVEDTVEKVLDYILHPKSKERVNIRETLKYFQNEAELQLDAPIETKDGRTIMLPPMVKKLGHELLDELIMATVSGVQLMLESWNSTIAEITNRQTGKDRGQGELKPHDIWLQKELGLPTPDVLKMDYAKENEQQAEARTAGLVERIMDRIGDKLRPAPAPAPVIDEEALAMRAAEMAQKMVKDTLEQMIADGKISFNSESNGKKEKSK